MTLSLCLFHHDISSIFHYFRAFEEDYPFPDRFIKELRNMPESAGIAFGIDRLVMLFADTDTIDDVVSFTPEEI